MIKNIQLNKIEKYVFLLVTVLNLIPVLQGKYFPSMDGAAHLYNSNIIKELIFKNNNLFELFFSFNEILVPNWIGHFLLSFLNFFFPAFIAEKALLLSYLIGLPYAFRALIKTIDSQNIGLSYFIFPFSYSFLFILGFYNFTISIILMLITLNYWMKNDNQQFSNKKILILTLLLTFTFFSHVFVFSLLVFFIGLHILFNLLYQSLSRFNNIKKSIKQALIKCGKLLIASFIPLFLLCFYFTTIHSANDYIFLEKQKLIQWIKQIRPIIAYNTTIEEEYTTKIFYILIVLVIISIYKRINSIIKSFELRKEEENTIYETKNILIKSDFWMILTFILLFLYFVLPDSDYSAGFVSVRLCLLFFIFLIIWLSVQKFSKWLVGLSVIFLIYFHFKLNIFYSSVIKDLNKVAVNCESATEHIEPNSIVLPINYNDNWLLGHFSNYLGVDNPIVILENYELDVGYFPLKWNENYVPNTLLGNIELGKHFCKQWKSNNQNSRKVINYVFVLGDFPYKLDSCDQVVKDIIQKNYDLIYKNESCNLFKIKYSLLTDD